MNTSRGSSSTSAASDGAAGFVGMVLLVGVAGFLLWIAVLAPGAAIALQLYAGVIAAPAAVWSGLAWNVLTGALAGLAVGWLRHRRRGLAAQSVADALVSPEMLAAARLGLATGLYHAILGAAAGALLGLLGLVSPLQLLFGGTGALGDPALAAGSLLAAAGVFNGGGAPPGAYDVWLVFGTILVLTVTLAALVGMIGSAAIAALALVMLGSAARAAGSAVADTLLLLAVPPRPDLGAAWEPRRRWVLRSLRSGFTAGLWSGTASALLVLAAVHLARGRVAAAMPGGPLVTRAGLLEPGAIDRIRQSRDRRSLILQARGSVVEWPLPDGRAVRWDPFARRERAQRIWETEGIGFGFMAGLEVPRADTVRGGPPGAAFEVVREDGRLVVVRSGTGERRELGLPAGVPVADVQAAARGSTVAAWIAAPADVLILWDAATGRELRRFHPALSFGRLSPDGRWLAAADGNRVRLWDLPAGTSRRLAGHGGEIVDLAWSEDGRWLASLVRYVPDGPSEVRLWEPGSGRAVWQGTGPFLEHVAFGPGYLAVWGFDRVQAYRIR